MTAITRTRAIGGSLVVTIPSEIVKIENLKDGEFVEIEIRKKKRNFFGSLKGIKSFEKDDELKGQME